MNTSDKPDCDMCRPEKVMPVIAPEGLTFASQSAAVPNFETRLERDLIDSCRSADSSSTLLVLC